MISHFMAAAAGLCYLATPAFAGPIAAPPVFQSGTANILQVQDSPAIPDVWRSPQSSLDEFPRHSPEDCDAYGRAYGYAECVAPEFSPETDASSTDPAGEKGTAAESAPIPTRRAAAIEATIRPPHRDPRPTSDDLNPASALDQEILPERLGQLVLTRFQGQSPEAAQARALTETLQTAQVAGSLIRAENVESPGQLTALIDGLRNHGDPSAIIMMERPGGPNSALRPEKGFSAFAAPREIAAGGDALAAFSAYQTMAAELERLGVTMNIGPQLGICRNETTRKCFAASPETAAAFATAFILAHRSERVLSALRYRHGSDADLAVLDAIMKRSMPDALVLEAIDHETGRETDLNARITALRQAGFTGAIIADTQSARKDSGHLLVATLKAGADMVLLPLTEIAVRDVDTAMQSGRLSRGRLDAALAAAKRLKEGGASGPSHLLSNNDAIGSVKKSRASP